MEKNIIFLINREFFIEEVFFIKEIFFGRGKLIHKKIINFKKHQILNSISYYELIITSSPSFCDV